MYLILSAKLIKSRYLSYRSHRHIHSLDVLYFIYNHIQRMSIHCSKIMCKCGLLFSFQKEKIGNDICIFTYEQTHIHADTERLCYKNYFLEENREISIRYKIHTYRETPYRLHSTLQFV